MNKRFTIIAAIVIGIGSLFTLYEGVKAIRQYAWNHEVVDARPVGPVRTEQRLIECEYTGICSRFDPLNGEMRTGLSSFCRGHRPVVARIQDVQETLRNGEQRIREEIMSRTIVEGVACR